MNPQETGGHLRESSMCMDSGSQSFIASNRSRNINTLDAEDGIRVYVYSLGYFNIEYPNHPNLL